MKLKFLYINPYEKHLPGIQFKIGKQLDALSKEYNTKEITLIPNTNNKFVQRLKQLLNESMLLIRLLFTDVIYYRFTPVCVICNIILSFYSFIKPIHIELNGLYKKELEGRKIALLLYKVSLFFLSLSKCKYYAASIDIIKEEKCFNNRSVLLPNGFDVPDETIEPSSEMQILIDQIVTAKKSSMKIWIFVAATDYPWTGIERIIKLVEKFDDAYFLLVGDFKYDYLCSIADRSRLCGVLKNQELALIYQYCDLAFGSFAMEKAGLKQASSLKVRAYLAYGVPALLNNFDPLLNEMWANDYIMKIDFDNLNQINTFIALDRNKEAFINIVARKELSWATAFRKAGLII